MKTFKLQSCSIVHGHIVEIPPVLTRKNYVIEWLRSLYRQYIKPHNMLRLILINFFSCGRFIRGAVSGFVGTLRGDELGLRPLDKVVVNSGWGVLELHQQELIKHHKPLVFPERDASFFNAEHQQLKFPRLYIAQVPQAKIYGGSNIVVAGGEVICHDLLNIEQDYISEELSGRAHINRRKNLFCWLHDDAQPLAREKAAVFLDACAGNYAHWLSEVLPRIALFCSQPQLDDVPIVVDAGLHKNIMDSLLAVTGDAREIITLPASRSMVVNTLYITSVAGYVPFDQRGDNTAEHSHGLFSRYSQRCMLERLSHQKQLAGQHAKSIDWPEKVYLRRTSGVRKLINNDALEAALETHGFVAVEPEALTFDQQVMLFQNARVIVSPTGAALANAIFCQPGAKVVVMMGRHKKMIYRYWLNMLSFLDVHVCYLLGTVDEKSGLGIHGDFKVDVNDFNCLMSRLNRV